MSKQDSSDGPKQIVVAGLGRFGTEVARRLYQMGHGVMAIDVNDSVVQKMIGEVTYPVGGDATDESVLRDLGVPEFDIGIVSIGSNIEASIMTAVLFKTLGLDQVIARAHNELHGNTLKRIGCSRVVHAEAEAGVRVAHNLFNPVAEDYLEITYSYGISKISVPSYLTGISLKDAGFTSVRNKVGVAVIALKRSDEVIMIPDPDEKIHREDTVFLSGPDSKIESLLKQSDS